MDPQYNLWMMPFLAAACGSAVVGWTDRWKLAARVAAFLLVVGNLGGAWVLVRHGSEFAHLPSRRISERLAQAGAPARLTVLHQWRDDWGYLYYPLRYRFGADLRQFLTSRGSDGKLLFQRLPDLGMEPSMPSPEDRLVLISILPLGATELTEVVRSGRMPEFPDERLGRSLQELGWQEESREVLIATAAAEIRWFRRKAP